MSAAEPLLSNENGKPEASQPHAGKTGSGQLGLSQVMKLKAKAKKWRIVAHEHALDQGMALGCGDITAARHMAAKHRRASVQQAAEAAGGPKADELPHDEKSYADVGGQSNTEAIMNLLNNCLGAGVLCVPFVVKNLGIATAICMLSISAVLNRFGLMLILKCMKITGVEASYNGVGRVAFGQPGRYAVVFIFIAMGFGCLVSYVDATADAVGDLLARFGFPIAPENRMYLQLSMTLILYPPTYIRSLSNVVPISIASFCGALIVVACVGAQCIAGIMEDGINFSPAMMPVDVGTLLKSIPTTLTIFSIQAGGSITMSSLKDGSQENKAKVSTIAYVIVLVVNLSVGLPSYLRFGEETKGNVLSSLPPDSILTLIAKICVLDLVVPSYMFMMMPCRVALIEMIWGKNEAMMEATWSQFVGVTTCVNLAAVFVALQVSDLSLVIGLVGAVAANSVAFILPCLFFMKARSDPVVKDSVEKVAFWSKANIPYFCLVCFSFFAMISGVHFLLAPKA